MEEYKQFLFAINKGILILVKRFVEQGIDVKSNDNEPLHVAIMSNTLSVCEFLLAQGSNPNVRHSGKLPIELACENGHVRIVKLLVKYNAEVTHKALVLAVEHGYAGCVKILMQGFDMTFSNCKLLFDAYRLGYMHIVKLLIDNKCDINAREGELLIDACEKGNFETVQELIKLGSDVNIRDGTALIRAALNGYTNIVLYLLSNGANELYLQDITLGFYLSRHVNDWKRTNRVYRLRNAIKNSFDPCTFKWQYLSRSLGHESLIQQQAKMFGVVQIYAKTKRALCADLAKQTEPLLLTNKSITGDYDLYGNAMNELPCWKLYMANGRLYNIFDLINLIKKGYSTCPYSRLPLPIGYIKRKRMWLQNVLTINVYNDFNLIEQIKSMPILDRETEMKTLLLNQVWSRLNYPPSVDLILQASDELIQNMINNLYYGTSPVANLYPMLTSTWQWNVTFDTGIEKKSNFIKMLVSIVRKRDEYHTMRIQLLNMLFQHYNVDGSERTDDQDLWTFMIMQDEDDLNENFVLPIRVETVENVSDDELF